MKKEKTKNKKNKKEMKGRERVFIKEKEVRSGRPYA